MFKLIRARAIVRSVNLRAEKHGPVEVPCCDLKLEIDRPNTDLAMLGPRLRDALFWRDPDADEDLVDSADPDYKPNLRAPEIKGPLAVSGEYAGFTVTIDYGLGGASDLVIEDCKVNRIKVESKEGGSVRITVRVQFLVDERLAGKLSMMLNHETRVTLAPPPGGGLIDESQDEDEEVTA